jgi:hypothetical protein
VIGQPVRVLAAAGVTAESFPVGTVVEVSGMRRGDGVIMASRVSLAPRVDVSRITGALVVSPAGVETIAGTPVQSATPIAIAAGEEVRATGTWSDGRLHAESIEALPRVPFGGRVARIDLEGFARAAANGQLVVGRFVIPGRSAGDALAAARAADGRIRVQGVVRDRQVIANRLEVVNDVLFSAPGAGGPGGMPPVPQGNRPPSGGGSPPPGGASPGGTQPPGARQPDRPDAGDPHGGGGDLGRPPLPEGRTFGVPAPDRPDRPDVPSRPDRPDRPDQPPAPDRPERPSPPDVQRPERPTRPERPDLPSRPGRP